MQTNPLPREYTQPGADFRTLEHGKRYAPPAGYRGEVLLREDDSFVGTVEYIEFYYPGYLAATTESGLYYVEYWENRINDTIYKLLWREV